MLAMQRYLSLVLLFLIGSIFLVHPAMDVQGAQSPVPLKTSKQPTTTTGQVEQKNSNRHPILGGCQDANRSTARPEKTAGRKINGICNRAVKSQTATSCSKQPHSGQAKCRCRWRQATPGGQTNTTRRCGEAGITFAANSKDPEKGGFPLCRGPGLFNCARR